MSDLLASIRHPQLFVATMLVVLTLELAMVGAILSEVLK